MKNVLINRNLIFIFALFLIVSCSKKSDEVTPSTLAGKWKHNGVTGKVIVGTGAQAQTVDINEPADNSIIEFKNDGTGVYDGTPVTYKTSGSILTITAGGQTLEFTAKVNGSNLTMSFTKDQFFKALTLVADTSDPDTQALIGIKDKITTFDYNINYIKQ
jgi:hypothetical protein